MITVMREYIKRIQVGNIFRHNQSKKTDYNLRYDSDLVFRESFEFLDNIDKDNISKIKPSQIVIMANLRCNSKCIYCCVKDNINRKELFSDLDLVNKLIEDIRDIGIKYILIVGGEPFFYKKNMIYFLEKLKDLDCFIIMNTNSTLLKKRDIKKIVKNELISCLSISLNSDCDELEYKISGDKKRHSKTICNLKLVDYYKRKYDAKIPYVVIMFAMFNLNYHSILNILNQVKEYNVNGFVIQPMRVYEKKDEVLKLNEYQKQEFLKMVPELIEVAEKYKIDNRFSDFLKEDLIENATSLQKINKYEKIYNKKGIFFNCYFPLSNIAVDWEGKFFGCPFYFSEKNQLTLDYYTNNLREFVKSKSYIDHLKNFINKKKLPEFCKNCNLCELNRVRMAQDFFKKNK